jgi:hypothetical protein
MRAFVLRCFAPSGSLTANVWLSKADLLLWPLVFLVLAFTARGRSMRVLIFAGLATAAALVPVLPLTISVSTTESERFVYVATVFSSIVLVWSIRTALRWRTLAVAICLAVISWHAVSLIVFNLKWREAGMLTHRIVQSYADQVLRHDPDGRARIFILNLADNVGGPFVFRTGFYPAVELGRPEVAHRTAMTIGVASTTMPSPNAETRVVRTGPRSFSVDFNRDEIVQPQVPSTAYFQIVRQTRTSYDIEFSHAVDRAIVLYQSGGRLEYAGTIGGH